MTETQTVVTAEYYWVQPSALEPGSGKWGLRYFVGDEEDEAHRYVATIEEIRATVDDLVRRGWIAEAARTDGSYRLVRTVVPTAVEVVGTPIIETGNALVDEAQRFIARYMIMSSEEILLDTI